VRTIKNFRNPVLGQLPHSKNGTTYFVHGLPFSNGGNVNSFVKTLSGSSNNAWAGWIVNSPPQDWQLLLFSLIVREPSFLFAAGVSGEAVSAKLVFIVPRIG
jgi:hypothetical protein